MKSVDTIRAELNSALRELAERKSAVEVLERLHYDVSPIPDDYHKWQLAVQRYRDTLDKVAFLETELMRCGNR